MGRSSYWTSTMGISLLLLLLGIVAFTVIGGQRVVRDIADGVVITAFIDQDMTLGERRALEEQIRRMPNVQRIVYISADEALKDFSTYNDIDTTMISNAIPPSFEITPRAIDDTPKISSAVRSLPRVDQVFYPKEAVDELAAKIKLGSGIALIAGLMIVLVILMLIYITIKLSIASFTIPGKGHVKRAAIQGFLSAMIALALLISFGGLLSWALGFDLVGDDYFTLITLLGSALCVIGVTICTLMTAVTKGQNSSRIGD